MSSLNKLPEEVLHKILSKDKNIRHDLLFIPEMEKDGWSVNFKNDNWRNSASFDKDNIYIWYSPRGDHNWVVATLSDERFTNHQYFYGLKEAIENARRILQKKA